MSKLSEQCELIYVTGGQYAVYDFIEKSYPSTPWAWCEECDCKSPRDTDYACLVCASPTKPLKGRN